MTSKIVIIGAGGVAREVHDVLEAVDAQEKTSTGAPAFEFLGFIAEPDAHSHLLGSRGPLLGGDSALAQLEAGTHFVIGIGSGAIRARLAKLAEEAGLTAATLVHPTAIIGNHGNSLGKGTVVAAYSSLTTDISVGEHCFIDRNVTVGHDSILENFVSLYPSCSISGNVRLGRGVTVGTGARVLQGLSVAHEAFVGAGAVVVSSVESNRVVVGVPARELNR